MVKEHNWMPNVRKLNMKKPNNEKTTTNSTNTKSNTNTQQRSGRVTRSQRQQDIEGKRTLVERNNTTQQAAIVTLPSKEQPQQNMETKDYTTFKKRTAASNRTNEEYNEQHHMVARKPKSSLLNRLPQPPQHRPTMTRHQYAKSRKNTQFNQQPPIQERTTKIKNNENNVYMEDHDDWDNPSNPEPPTHHEEELEENEKQLQREKEMEGDNEEDEVGEVHVDEVEYEMSDEEDDDDDEMPRHHHGRKLSPRGRRLYADKYHDGQPVSTFKITIEPYVMSYKGQHTSKSYPRETFEHESFERLKWIIFFSYHHHLYYKNRNIRTMESKPTQEEKLDYLYKKYHTHMECYDIVSKSRFTLPSLLEKQVKAWEKKSRHVHLNIYQHGIISRTEYKALSRKNIRLLQPQELPSIYPIETSSNAQYPTLKRRSITKRESEAPMFKIHHIMPQKQKNNVSFGGGSGQQKAYPQHHIMAAQGPLPPHLPQQPLPHQPMPQQQPIQPSAGPPSNQQGIVPLVNDSRRLSQNFYIGPNGPRVSTGGPPRRHSTRFSTAYPPMYGFYSDVRPSEEFRPEDVSGTPPPPPNMGDPKSPQLPIPTTVKEMVGYLKNRHPQYEAHDEAYWRSWAVAALQHKDSMDGVTQSDLLTTPPASIMNGFIIHNHNHRNSSLLNSPPMFDSVPSSYQHIVSRFQKNLEDVFSSFYMESRQYLNRRFSVMSTDSYYMHDPFPPHPLHEMPPHRKSTGPYPKSDEPT